MSRSPTLRLPAIRLGLLACVAVLAVAARFGRPFARLDRVVLDAVVDHRTDGALHLARFVTDTGTSPALFPLVAAAGIAVRVRTGSWRPGITALAVAALGVLARLGLSMLVREARPAEIFRAVPVGGFSFPSGHTVTSALIAGALAFLLSRLLPTRWARIAAAVLGLWAALVGLSRVYLGVHWLSDVVAGWLFAAAALTLLVAGPPPPSPVLAPTPLPLAEHGEDSQPDEEHQLPHPEHRPDPAQPVRQPDVSRTEIEIQSAEQPGDQQDRHDRGDHAADDRRRATVVPLPRGFVIGHGDDATSGRPGPHPSRERFSASSARRTSDRSAATGHGIGPGPC
jgi:membrane-associated phospholipid phosphatase